MLVFFDPALMCEGQTDLVLAPLPSKKKLWEAGDEITWESEIKRDGAHIDYGLAANGELVKIDAGQSYCHAGPVLSYKLVGASPTSSSDDNWEEWCSGMDGFGGLVMLAASLIS